MYVGHTVPTRKKCHKNRARIKETMLTKHPILLALMAAITFPFSRAKLVNDSVVYPLIDNTDLFNEVGRFVESDIGRARPPKISERSIDDDSNLILNVNNVPSNRIDLFGGRKSGEFVLANHINPIIHVLFLIAIYFLILLKLQHL